MYTRMLFLKKRTCWNMKRVTELFYQKRTPFVVCVSRH